MKLVILGVSASTGRHLVGQALEMEHEITSSNCALGELANHHGSLRVVERNIHHQIAAEQAVTGQPSVRIG